MANSDNPKKAVETFRERAERAAQKGEKTAESSDSKEKSSGKLERSRDEKIKKVHRFHVVPRFFPEAFSELRQVTWPDRRTTFKLTVAVVLFAVIFGGLVSGVDSVLSVIFKKVFLHG